MAEGGRRCVFGKGTQLLGSGLGFKKEGGVGKPVSFERGSPAKQERQAGPSFPGGSLGHCGSLSHAHGHQGVGHLPSSLPPRVL